MPRMAVRCGESVEGLASGVDLTTSAGRVLSARGRAYGAPGQATRPGLALKRPSFAHVASLAHVATQVSPLRRPSLAHVASAQGTALLRTRPQDL